MITGSFDGTAKIWDIRSGMEIDSYEDHTMELSNALFEFAGDYAATSSLDKTVKLWDLRKGLCLESFQHKDEVLDISFNYTGTLLGSVSADATGKLYSVAEAREVSQFIGHGSSISKICFNP